MFENISNAVKEWIKLSPEQRYQGIIFIIVLVMGSVIVWQNYNFNESEGIHRNDIVEFNIRIDNLNDNCKKELNESYRERISDYQKVKERYERILDEFHKTNQRVDENRD